MKHVVGIVLGVFFVFLFSGMVLSYSEPVESTSPSDEISTESAQPQKVNYELPYPGMLPDNPLYFLKMFRDGFVKALINDPYKKAEFNLLNAQKRMYAAKLLADKGKDELSFVTITKSNNYLHEALTSILIVKENNPKNTNVRPFLEQQKTVIGKHKEVLQEIENEVDKKYKADIIREEARMNEILKSIEKVLRSNS